MGAYHQELLEHLRSSLDSILWVFSGFPEHLRQWAPNDEWSIHQIAAHLVDIERRSYLPRIRKIIDEPSPDLPTVTNEEPSSEDLRAGNIEEHLQDFQQARQEGVSLLRSLSDEQWTRWGTHYRWGRTTVEFWAEMMLHHTYEHLQQVLTRRREMRLAHLL